MSLNSNNQIIEQAFQFLNQFTNYERQLRYPYNGWAMNLERVRILLKEVGSPEKTLPAIHLAGTKGKGSTSKFVQSILSAVGYKVGLYTSPHLLKVNERIQINDSSISDLELAQAIASLKPGVQAVRENKELGEVTYFELLTASAFYYFSLQKVDYAVLETGLGGRYDATNVCNPKLVIITPISFDHTDILGNTLQEIAQEKAMIIKQNCPVVMSVQPEPAKKVIEQRAEQVKAQLFPVENYYQFQLNSINPQEMNFDLLGKRNLIGLKTKMLGPAQMINCASALLACDLLSEPGAKISDSEVRQGIERALLPARFQQVQFQDKTIILDGAHNQESAKALAQALSLIYPEKKYNFIIGLSQDKDIEGFLKELKPRAHQIIFSQARLQRAVGKERLINALGECAIPVAFESEIHQALEKMISITSSDEIIIITGSFYLVGDALEWLSGKPSQ